MRRFANFGEARNFTKSKTPPWVFLTFLNCTNGAKSRNVLHMFPIMIFSKIV